MDIEKHLLALEREIEKRFPMKDCPRCDAEVSMILVNMWSDKESFKGYRCLKCNTLYEEVLKLVEET